MIVCYRGWYNSPFEGGVDSLLAGDSFMLSTVALAIKGMDQSSKCRLNLLLVLIGFFVV